MLWMLPTLAAAATLEVPTAYADLEAALDAAQIGDIVVLAAGPHSWSSDRTNLSVSLRGAGPLTQVQFTGSVDTSIVELTDLTLVELRREFMRVAPQDGWHSPVAAMNTRPAQASYLTGDGNLLELSFSVH